MSVVERIKSLEDRILYLEGVSPEYFNANNKPLNTRSPSFVSNAHLHLVMEGAVNLYREL